jgi:hypothetical protein
MAKSKLIANRKKRSTIISSKRTVEDAIARGGILASAWMESDQNDPRLNKLQNIIDHLSSLLNMSPQDMRQQGVSNIEEFFDDSVKPDVAQTVKREVEQIAQWTQEQRPAGSPTPEQQGVGYAPDQAVADRGIHASEEETDMKKANGGSFFTTDRDEKGEPKSPEKVMVPRLAKKKKEAVPEEPVDAAPLPEAEPMPAPAAPAPATPAPAAGGSAIDYIPTETLIKVVQDLSKELSDAAQGGNKAGVEDAIIEITNVLKARPVLPPEQPEVGKAPAQSTAPALAGGAAAPAAEPAPPAAPLPATASKKADYGDHRMAPDGTVNSGSGASAQFGQGGNAATPEPISVNPTPEKSKVDLGGLSIASSLEEKTAEDYRLHDYKLLDQDEGIVPAGQLPNADEQANQMHPEEHEMEACMSMDGSMEKEAVTPPGVSEELMHKLKREYPGDKEKAYATAWSIHNKKESALKTLEAAARLYAEVSKVAAGGAEGNWVNDIDEKGQVIEDGGRTPEVGQAHAAIDEAGAALNRPATVPPIKLKDQAKKTAADMTTSKAVKEAERLGTDLKKMYLDAKSLTGVNDTRAVREAVEGIFHAADRFDEAAKVLNKQQQQEESEAEAQEMKAKNKKSSFGGLAVAAGE